MEGPQFVFELDIQIMVISQAQCCRRETSEHRLTSTCCCAFFLPQPSLSLPLSLSLSLSLSVSSGLVCAYFCASLNLIIFLHLLFIPRESCLKASFPFIRRPSRQDKMCLQTTDEYTDASSKGVTSSSRYMFTAWRSCQDILTGIRDVSGRVSQGSTGSSYHFEWAQYSRRLNLSLAHHVCCLSSRLVSEAPPPIASASGFWQTGNQTCLKTVGQRLGQLRMRWGHISDLLELEDHTKHTGTDSALTFRFGFRSRNKEIDRRRAKCGTSCNLHQALHNACTTKKQNKTKQKNSTALKTDRNFLWRSRRPLGWLLWVWSARQLYTKNTRWRRNFSRTSSCED